MANSAVTFVLQNLMQLLVNEADLLKGVEDEIKSLRTQLDLMFSFLRDSEAASHEQEAVKVLIGQIRNLSYDAEDVINEYIAKAMQYHMKSTPWKKFTNSFDKLLTQHRVGKEIKEVRNKMKEIYDNKNQFGIEFKPAVRRTPDGSASGFDTLQRRRRNLYTKEVDDVVGFVDEEKTIIKRLIEGSYARTVVSIVGMGGLGKTTLAKKVFKSFSITDTFECRALVYVSQEYKPRELLLAILKQFTKITEEMKDMNEEDLGKEVRGQVINKMYLIVLDDVWQNDVWDDLAAFLPDDENGSRVLFTTRLINVALHANPDRMNPPHFLRFLDKEESWELFQNKVFGGGSCSKQWEDLGRQIAEKCGGLPLAIVVLGGLLAEKRATFQVWSDVVNRVSSLLSSERDRLCADILALSYYDLPYYLKPCFLYVGMFPEDYMIPAKQLIRQWVAEGFINPKGQKTLEETAEDYLDELVERSLIQVVAKRSDGGVKSCSIHDLLRDLCVLEAQKENFFEVHWSENSTSTISSLRVAGNSLIFDKFPEKNHFTKRLRSILCFTEEANAKKSLYNCCYTLQMIRLINIEGLGIELIGGRLCNLIHLKYLRIGRSNSLELPNDLCDLFNLQTLDIRSRFIKEVPSSIWRLKRLRHLYCLGEVSLPPPPPSMALQELQTFSTLCAESCTPETMAGMPNLLKMGIRTTSEDALLSPSIATLQHVRTMKFEQPYWRKQDWISQSQFPTSLTKLTFVNTLLGEDIMPRLAELPNLQILKWLRASYKPGSTMTFSANGFQCLQVLQFIALDAFIWIVEEGGLPNLNRLVVRGYGLRNLPEALWSIRDFSAIDVQNPSWELRQLLQEIQKRDLPKISIYPPHAIEFD